MRQKGPAIRISRDNIDDLSLACINPPVSRRYTSCFKSKLAMFAESIEEYTLMNIMEYLIKFKQWFLSIRLGHRSPIVLFEDLLIIGILRVNKNQLLHTETALISQKLGELLHRTAKSFKDRFYNFLLFLKNQEINRAISTNTDFIEMRVSPNTQIKSHHLEIRFLAAQRQLWAKSKQRFFNQDKIKGQNQIKSLVRQRMAAIRMHYLNTSLYTYRDSKISKKMIQLDQSDLHSNIFTERISIKDHSQNVNDKEFYTDKKERKQKQVPFLMNLKKQNISKYQIINEVFPSRCQTLNQLADNVPNTVSNRLDLTQNKQIGQIAQIILKYNLSTEDNKDFDKLSLWHKVQTQRRKKQIKYDVQNAAISNNLDDRFEFSQRAKNFHLFLEGQMKKVEFEQIQDIDKTKVISSAHRFFNQSKFEVKQFSELANKYEGFIIDNNQKMQQKMNRI